MVPLCELQVLENERESSDIKSCMPSNISSRLCPGDRHLGPKKDWLHLERQGKSILRSLFLPLQGQRRSRHISRITESTDLTFAFQAQVLLLSIWPRSSPANTTGGRQMEQTKIVAYSICRSYLESIEYRKYYEQRSDSSCLIIVTAGSHMQMALALYLRPGKEISTTDPSPSSAKSGHVRRCFRNHICTIDGECR